MSVRLDSIIFTVASIYCVAIVPSCSTAPPSPADTTGLGSGLDENADPAETAAAISDEIDALIPTDTAKIVGVLRPQTGPAGSIMGLALDNDTKLFALGELAEDGTATFTGAVLEDNDGNLIMMQESRDDSTTITLATGDSIDADASGTGLRLTVTSNATTPPSVLVWNLDASGEAVMDEEASSIQSQYNEDYNVGRIRLERGDPWAKQRPTSKAADDCPLVDAIGLTISRFCFLWGLITNEAPLQAIDAVCMGSQTFLDGLRGSDPLPGGDGGEEYAPKTIAGMKVTMEFVCRGIEGGWEAGQYLRGLSVPDLSCMLYSLADEGSRLLTTEGRNLPELICDSITPLTIQAGCSNACATADNGRCEDGGPLSVDSTCLTATDCGDCGVRDVPGCSNLCETARNDICEEGITCEIGSDCYDCGGPTAVDGCSETCDLRNDGDCNDGGEGSLDDFCEFGTDCTDCGPRDPEDAPDEPTEECTDDGFCNPDCPIDSPDINCTNDDLCQADGRCCNGDGICDFQSCNELDSDCTNENVCEHTGYCCDDDNICNSAEAGFDCPTPDADCEFCGREDALCIEDCVPEDPDCVDSQNCPIDDVCEPDCVGTDADCDQCVEDGTCIDGCVPTDPDCTEPGGEDPTDVCTTWAAPIPFDTEDFEFGSCTNFEGGSTGDVCLAEISVSGTASAVVFSWTYGQATGLTLIDNTVGGLCTGRVWTLQREIGSEAYLPTQLTYGQAVSGFTLNTDSCTPETPPALISGHEYWLAVGNNDEDDVDGMIAFIVK